MHSLRLACLGSALFVLPTAASAQVKASEPASITQTIDGTKLTIEYSRPRDRGRKELFGGQVHWGEVWTPGANKATTLEVSKDITLSGHAVPKGKYSVWMVPMKKGAWLALLDTNNRRFHTQRPDTATVPIRFAVEAKKGPFVPTLTWGFEDLEISGARLTMRWGNLSVAMDLAVQPTFELRVSEAMAMPYVGWYDLVVEPVADTTRPYRPLRGTIHIEYRNGSLHGKVASTVIAAGKEQHWTYEVLLLPNKDGSFAPGFTLKGELSEMAPGYVYEFKRSDGTVTGMEERYNDKLEGTYVRRR